MVPIDLHRADLGRHIMNGYLFFKGEIPFFTNFYSYSEPDFFTINHHWGYGVIIYLVYSVFGFVGTSIFNIGCYVTAFLFTFLFSCRLIKNLWAPFFSALLFLPIYAYRVEVRPEALSMLFLALFWIWIDRKYHSSWSLTDYFFVFFLFLLWVNIHLFFVLGWVVFFVYFLLSCRDTFDVKRWLSMATVVLIASLFNPNFVDGIIEPFLIFKEYGYEVAENQTLFFILKRFNSGFIIWYLCTLFFFYVSSLIIFFRNKDFILSRKRLWLCVLIFSLGSFYVVRLLPYCVIFLVPSFSFIFSWFLLRSSNFFCKYVCLFVMIVFSFYFGLRFPFILSPLRPFTGVGVMNGALAASDFIHKSQLRSPIFNNYDIGGYLIFSSFPDHKVFVDNRPESYSVSFLKNCYIEMQKDERVWDYYSNLYDFQTIIFDRRDITPWAQPFLIRRIKDPDWVPVFVDYATLILIKNNHLNRPLITKYALPDSIFKLS